MLTNDEIKNRVTYHPPTPAAIERHNDIRVLTEYAMKMLVAIVPEGREQSLALTKVEEMMYHANAGIARNHDKLGVYTTPPSIDI